MPDFNPLVLQPPAQVQPTNPLTQVGGLVDIRNALQHGQVLQQQVQQQQMATQQQADNQKFDAYLSSEQQNNPSGSPDPNKAGMWLAQNAPLSYQHYQDWKNGRLALTPQGVDPITGAAISKPFAEQQADISAPGSHTIATSVPYNTLPPTAVKMVGNQPTYVGGPLGNKSGDTPSGAALGQEGAANITSGESAKSGVGLRTRADQVAPQKALLGNLDAALDQFTAGPGADWTKVAKAMTNRVSPVGNIFDPKSIASQEEFTKQAVQLAQSQFQALGGTGTDSKLDSAMHTSPNDALSNLGNKGIIAMLKGNEDAIATKNKEWQQWKKTNNDPNGSTYDDFSTNFNQNFDPRVFQSKYMTADDKAKMIKSMDANELNNFKKNYNLAHENGWVK